MKDGQRNGKGIFIWSTEDSKGHTYQGEWKDDEKIGKGIYKYANGEIYEGEWKDNEVVGNLKYIKKGEPNKDFEEIKIMLLIITIMAITIKVIELKNLKKKQKEVSSEINMEVPWEELIVMEL